ncbi:hypothetical protein KIM67_10640 [Flagellimonas sp. 389]|nr:hypothetical protein [Flagellimonas sp. 389]MBS9462870.1 hypothetical protein [Flagellimonas sp. 389]
MKHLYPFFIAIVTLVSCKKELTGNLLLQGINIIDIKTGKTYNRKIGLK